MSKPFINIANFCVNIGFTWCDSDYVKYNKVVCRKLLMSTNNEDQGELAMIAIRKISLVLLFVSLCTTFVGCGPTRPNDEKWTLPKREGSDTGMIIGRLDYPENKSDNPKDLTLRLFNVDFWKEGKSVYFNANGEPSVVLNNDYFVIPNLKPGKYYFVGFQAGNVYLLCHASMKSTW